MQRNSTGDAARALQRNVQTIQTVLAQRAFHCRLHTQKNAERSVRSWITADIASGIRQARNELRASGDFDHVGNAHADILGSNVATAEMLDSLAEGMELIRRFRSFRVGEDHGLAAAEWHANHRVLVAHAA